MVIEIGIKKPLQYIRDGRIVEFYSYIKKNDIEITNIDSINILISLCGACIPGKYKIPMEYLAKIFNLCHFEDLNEDAITHYVQSIYYILKHFVENNKIYEILRIEHILIPKFIKYPTDQQINFYKISSQLFHNGLAEELKTCKGNKELIYSLVKFGIKMSQTVEDNFLVTVTKFIPYLISSKVNSKWIIYYYLEILPIMETYVDIEKQYDKILNMLIIICRHLFKEQKMNESHEIIDKTIADLKNKSILEEHKLVLVLLKQMFNLFVSIESGTEICFGDCSKNLKIAVEKYKSSIIVIDVFLLFGNCLINASKSWSSISDDIWSKKMNINVQFVFNDIITNLIKILKHVKEDCCCKYKYDVHLTCNLLLIMGNMCYNNVMLYNGDKHKVVLSNFELIFKYLEILNDYKCTKFNLLWKLTGTLIFNILLKLYRNKNVIALKYALVFIKRTIQFEGTSDSIIGKDVLASVLEVYLSLCSQNGEYLTVQKMSAFAVYLFPHKNSLLHQWSKAKSELKFSETIVDILIENETYYKTFQTEYHNHFNTSSKFLLLQAELNHYKTHWRSSTAIRSVYIALYNLGDSLLTAKEILMVDTDDNLKMKDILDIYENIIIEFEDTALKDSETLVILGCLYYLLYFQKNKKLIEQNQEDMDSAKMFKTEESDKLSTDVGNPNDACDMVSSYRNLKLDIHNNLIDNLNKSFKYIQEGFKYAAVSIIEEYRVFNFIERLAHTYTLHCYTNKSLNAWKLALQISKLTKNNSNILQCISFIIEKTSLDKYSLQLIKEAEAIIKEFQINGNTNDLQIFIFFVSLCLTYLSNEMVDDCMKTFELATEYFFKLESYDDDHQIAIARIRYNSLHGSILNLPCKYGISHHEDFSLIKPVAAQELSISYIKTHSNLNDYILSVSFEMTENLLNLYCWTRQPREVRCYGRHKILLAQQLLVPFRTCRLLVYLAKADILSSRYEDSQIKLDGLSDMLLIRKTKSNMQENLEQNINEVSDSLNELMLEFPSTAQPRFASAASPVLYTESFKIPSFLSDKKNCDCIPCTTIEYQKLLLQKLHLDAMLSYSNGNIQAAEAFFKASLFIYGQLKNRNKARNMNFDNCINIYCSIILDYNKLLVLNRKTDLAIKNNTEILDLVKSSKNKNHYLYNEILAQRFLILTNSEPFFKDNFADYQNEIEELDVVVDANGSTTPINKITKINFKNSVSPNFETNDRIIKPIPFNLGEISPTAHAPKISNTRFNIYTPRTEGNDTKIISGSKNIKKKLDFTPQDVLKSVKTAEIKNTRKRIEFAPKAMSTFIAKSTTGDNNTKKLTDKIKKSTFKAPDILVTKPNLEIVSSKVKQIGNKLTDDDKSEKLVKTRRILKDDTNSTKTKKLDDDKTNQDKSKGAIRRTARRIK